jgi:hypothetical protein
MITRVLALLGTVGCAIILGLGLLYSFASAHGVLVEDCAVPTNYPTIQDAADDPFCAVVVVDSGAYTETVTIARSVTIEGQGAADTIVSGNRSGRVFTVEPGQSLTLTELTVTDGLSPFYHGEGWRQPGGGVFVSNGRLVMSRTTIINNQAGPGGGIGVEDSTVVIQASSIVSNLSYYGNVYFGGGGLFSNGDSEINIVDSVVRGNEANHAGGGIRFARGTLSISRTLLADNKADVGGALNSRRIYEDEGPMVHIFASSFMSNSSNYEGAAIKNGYGASMTVISTTVVGNSGQSSIANEDRLTLKECEIIGNTGVAIDNGSRMSVEQSEIIGNQGYTGGGIRNRGTMTLTDSLLALNQAERGGGLVNGTYPSHNPRIKIIGSAFLYNEATSQGGAIYSSGSYGSRVIITGSLFAYNSANGFDSGVRGGAIVNDTGYMQVDNSTIMYNRSNRSGGAIFNENGGELFVTNATISHNRADQSGGAILNSSSLLVLVNSTVCYNQAGYSGNAFQSGSNSDPQFTVVNSIVVANGERSCNDSFDGTSLGHNILSDSSCNPASTDLVRAGLALFPKLYQAGWGLVYELIPGSVAIDAARPDYCPALDQRGVGRPIDGDHDGVATCDIGSYEFDPDRPPDVKRIFLPAISK